jgi:hypothetical protein
MARLGDKFSPGEIVLVSGIYRCTACGSRSSFSTDVRGKVFPPSHHAGAKWELVEATPHRS